MGAKPAPSANLLALPDGTELVGDYRIARVLGAGGFGITYLADETALGRHVTIKEYFPAEFAARRDTSAVPRSRGLAEEYQWGLDRFIEEAQTLARFDHPNIVRVHRYFRANNTGYMVLHFEEGGSFKAWLKNLKRAPRQAELDRMIAPLLDALEIIHNASFLHRDIAPDNIMVRKDGSPVLIDFGSARGAIASHSRTVSALVKPGYSPYEQYATSGANQGPWTDIYALGATLYHAIAGKRPPDAPSRVVNDEYVPAREAARSTYRETFLDAVDSALRIEISQRPQCIAEWRGPLLAPEPARKVRRSGATKPPTSRTLAGRLGGANAPAAPARKPKRRPQAAVAVAVAAPDAAAEPASVPASLVPAPPDAPQRQGQLLDFIEALRKHRPAALAGRPARSSAPAGPRRAPAVAGAPVAPAAAPAPRRTRRRRRWAIPARRWGSGLFRVVMAVSITGLVVAYEEGLRRSAADGTGRAAGAAAGAPTAPVMQLAGHRGPVLAVASANEDRWIVSAGADATVRLWNAGSGEMMRTIALAKGAVTAFAVDGHYALAGHKEGTVVLWDLQSGRRLHTFRHGSAPITSVAFLGDHLVAARRNGGIALFDRNAPATTPAAVLGGEKTGPLIAAAHSDGLLVSTGVDRTLRLWRAREQRLLRTWRLAGETAAVAIAPDASYLAGGSVDGVVRIEHSPALEGARSQAAQTFKAHNGRVTAIALSPQGMLASAGADGRLKLWTLRPQRVVRALDGGQVRSLGFSHDGRRLLAGGQDGGIRIWSLRLPRTAGAS